MTTNIQKHDDVNRYLGGDETIHLCIRPDIECLIPTHLYSEDYAIFQIGYDMEIPIPDLRITQDGFAGTLSFRGKPFHCYVPWENVFAVFCGKRNIQKIYDKEVMEEVTRAEREAATATSEQRHAIRPPPLGVKTPVHRPAYIQVVDGERKKSFFDNVKRGPLADRSHLRVVQG